MDHDNSQEGQAQKWFKPGNKETAKQAEEKDFAFVSKEVAYTATVSLHLTG